MFDFGVSNRREEVGGREGNVLLSGLYPIKDANGPLFWVHFLEALRTFFEIEIFNMLYFFQTNPTTKGSVQFQIR